MRRNVLLLIAVLCSLWAWADDGDKFTANGEICLYEASLVTELDGFSGKSNMVSFDEIKYFTNVTSMGNAAFDGCECLSSISLPEQLETIGDYAFKGCYGIKKLTIPSNVKLNSNIEETDWNEGAVTVTVDVPGRLRLVIAELDEGEVKRLIVKGNLNGADMAFIHEGSGLLSGVESIDLSNVTLITGNEPYATTSYISDMGNGKIIHKYYISDTDSKETVSSSSNGLGGSNMEIAVYSTCLASAFSGTSYSRIVMPQNIKKAGEETFSGCSNLHTIEFSNGLESVDNRAFYNCPLLQSMDLSDTQSIGEEAFYGCTQLSNIGNTANLKDIGFYAFGNCSSLTGTISLTQVDSIPNYAFSDCQLIEGVVFCQNLRYIGIEAFSNCSSLQNVIGIPSELQSVDYSSFMNTALMANAPSEGGIKYLEHIALAYDFNSGVAGSSPATLTFREGTKSIANNFRESLKEHAQNVTAVEFPSTLLRIGTSAFSNPNKYPGFYALSIATLNIPEGIETIGESAFRFMTTLTGTITLPEGLKEVGDESFANCEKITRVIYNATDVKGSRQFTGCTGIARVTIGAKVRHLPESIFESCTGLTVAKFEERTDAKPLIIGGSAFRGCSNLVSVQLPSGTQTIGKNAFSNCSSLEELTLPETLNEIKENAFHGCAKLPSVTIPATMDCIGERAFFGCTSLVEVVLQEGLIAIGNSAFSGCSSLPLVVLPNSLCSIGSYAFEKCSSLTEIELPGALLSIDQGAFQDCINMEKVISHIEAPMPIGSILSNSGPSGVFVDPNYHLNLYEDVILYVPKGTRQKYIDTQGWNLFFNIEELDDGTGEVIEYDRLRLPEVRMISGIDAPLNISFNNQTQDFTAYQFDIVLPNKVYVGNGEVLKGERYADDSHVINVRHHGPISTALHSYKVECHSASNSLITGTDGLLLTIPLYCTSEGDYSATIQNIMFVRADGTSVNIGSELFIIHVIDRSENSGDVNGDGGIDVSDAVSVINYILEKPTDNFVTDAADLNYDGEIDVFDVTLLINMVLHSSSSARVAAARSHNVSNESMLLRAENNLAYASVNHEERFTAFQFDLTVPGGSELLDVSIAGMTNHNVCFMKTSENSYRVVATSIDNSWFKSSAKGLLALRFAGCSPKEVDIDNVLFVSPTEQNYSFGVKWAGTTTGIQQMTETESEKIFDLFGRSVSPAKKLDRGVYIINNKKTVVK